MAVDYRKARGRLPRGAYGRTSAATPRPQPQLGTSLMAVQPGPAYISRTAGLGRSTALLVRWHTGWCRHRVGTQSCQSFSSISRTGAVRSRGAHHRLSSPSGAETPPRWRRYTSPPGDAGRGACGSVADLEETRAGSRAPVDRGEQRSRKRSDCRRPAVGVDVSGGVPGRDSAPRREIDVRPPEMRVIGAAAMAVNGLVDVGEKRPSPSDADFEAFAECRPIREPRSRLDGKITLGRPEE